MNPPRAALFTDCFHDVNGVALTCRELRDFALRRGLPLLNVHAGPHTAARKQGTVTELEFRRSAAAIPVDAGLAFDPLLLHRLNTAQRAVERFRADVVHITSPGDFGILGALVAHRLHLPLVASWHTNLHEFAARRLERLLSPLPDSWRTAAAQATERWTFHRLAWFYSLPRLLFAPNPELVQLLAERCQRPVLLMKRGVDTQRFSPAHRRRDDAAFVIGFSGRLRAEKNVRVLVEIERALLAAGHRDYRFLICGDGSEASWLKANLQRAEFPGFLHGAALSEAYASMDLFVFPSRTDTFGNVVQEAFASGVPAVVSNDGGPKFIVRHGHSGLIATTEEAFIAHVLRLVEDRALHRTLCENARLQALDESWDRVFETVWHGYHRALRPSDNPADSRLLPNPNIAVNH